MRKQLNTAETEQPLCLGFQVVACGRRWDDSRLTASGLFDHYSCRCKLCVIERCPLGNPSAVRKAEANRAVIKAGAA